MGTIFLIFLVLVQFCRQLCDWFHLALFCRQLCDWFGKFAGSFLIGHFVLEISLMEKRQEKEEEVRLGFGYLHEEEKVEADVAAEDDGLDGELPPINLRFRKTDLWECKRPPLYDDRTAGARNAPARPRDLSPLDIVLLFFPLPLWKLVVLQTNLYFLQQNPNRLDRLLTVRELFVWVGLHLMMINTWSHNQDAYWLGVGGFDARQYMSRRRFYWIKRWIHFNDSSKKPARDAEGWDPVYELRPIIDALNINFRKYWQLSRYVSLDEMMVHFKGRNPHHCYVPGKPHPNGTKLHAICDARYFFCVAFEVSTKTPTTIVAIARRLFRGNVVPGMTVVTDRYYTCTQLVRLCLSLSVGFIGNTMNLRFLAKHCLTGWSREEAKERPRGDFDVAANEGGSVCCVVWKDKGVVRLTITAESTARCYLTRRASGMPAFLVCAPRAVEVFDQYFHGVDRNDQLRGVGYGLVLSFRARRWTVKLFMGLLDIVFSNAWIWYKFWNPRKSRNHRGWFRKLSEELVGFNPEGDPVYERDMEVEEVKVNPHRSQRLKRKRSNKQSVANCAFCSTAVLRRRTSFGCAECMVPLHKECSKAWHTLSESAKRAKHSRTRTFSFEEV